jgi:AraC-like DNA-binding protein
MGGRARPPAARRRPWPRRPGWHNRRMYRERTVGPDLAGAVLWTDVRGRHAPPGRVLPDGCMDLIWSSVSGLFVAGPDTAAQIVGGPAGERYVGLRLAPGVGPAVLGVPADALRDQRVPLAALWPARRVRELADRVEDEPSGLGGEPSGLGGEPSGTGGEPSGIGGEPAGVGGGPAGVGGGPAGIGGGPAGVGAALVAAAVARLGAAGGPDPVAGLVARRMAAGRPVAAVAVETGLGERQLHRRSRLLFGYGPKTLARILRLRRALALAYAGLPAAEVAARAGYADQPHLSREVRALAGVPLGALTARRADDER